MLYILHGWSYSVDKWKPFLKLLEQNGIGYELLKIPGLTAQLSRVWNLNDYVNWLKEKVSKNEEKVILLGHSNGGRIAAAYTAISPERVQNLILINSAGIIHKDLKTKLKKFLFGATAKAGKSIINSSSLRNLFYKVVGEQDYNKADENLKKTMVNLTSQDLSEIFKQINVPTLIVWGEEDSITPAPDGKKINELISGSKLFVVPNAKHSPQFTHPKEVADIIARSLIGRNTR